MFRFVAINGVGVYLYAIVYQAQDEEDYGGAWEMLKEGMLSSSAFFVVSLSVRLVMQTDAQHCRSIGSYGTQPVTMDKNIIIVFVSVSKSNQ